MVVVQLDFVVSILFDWSIQYSMFSIFCSGIYVCILGHHLYIYNELLVCMYVCNARFLTIGYRGLLNHYKCIRFKGCSYIWRVWSLHDVWSYMILIVACLLWWFSRIPRLLHPSLFLDTPWSPIPPKVFALLTIIQAWRTCVRHSDWKTGCLRQVRKTREMYSKARRRFGLVLPWPLWRFWDIAHSSPLS